MRKSPQLQVGILFQKQIKFTLNQEYVLPSGESITGAHTVLIQGSKLLIKNHECDYLIEAESQLMPCDYESGSFTLHDVTIGVDFHWERQEDQTFKGSLKFIVEDDKLGAVNILPLEDYLLSVISSEMSASSSLELLKAHAVISRSWLLAQIQKNKELSNNDESYLSHYQNANKIIKWYDREDHTNFDVCADDHCQRYQGITRNSNAIVDKAVKATFGEVLIFDDAICDARFSKCCGGMVEVFENVWEPVHHAYLQSFVDSKTEPSGFDLKLTDEGAARKWILAKPDCFCNTNDKTVLSQVLNDYDQETFDFFRWKQSYTQEELSKLVKARSGIDFGLIKELEPVERGKSGRLIQLRIVGEKCTKVIGKELEIRKVLSKSHLYSSAFIIEKEVRNKQTTFHLKGAGWGHGVGLCQIGAAVMGAKGYDYEAILMHYYRGAEINRKY